MELVQALLDHGGWAAIIINNNEEIEIMGGVKSTTNNMMELTAVIEALKELQEPTEIELYSDSSYVVNAINQDWLKKWKRNGWRTSNRKSVKNHELWLELDGLVRIHNVTFFKVKGHSDNVYNNRCDKLAVKERNKYI